MKVDELIMPAPGGAIPKGQSTGSNPDSGLKDVERIRSVFPETWLWRNFTAGFVDKTRFDSQFPFPAMLYWLKGFPALHASFSRL